MSQGSTNMSSVMAIAMATTLALLLPTPAPLHGQNFTQSTVPDPVYKNDDGSKRNTESWFFRLIVADSEFHGTATPVEATVESFDSVSRLETRTYSREALATMTGKGFTVPKEATTYALVRKFQRPELFDIGFEFAERPISWKTKHVRISLVILVDEKKKITLSKDVPVLTYAQKTVLVFPFRGPGIISQGQINNGGHSGHSNQFAIDAIALDSIYAPMVNLGDSNNSYAAWGKELIAPAAGTVIYARNDVPDAPPNTDPESTYSKVHDPLLATGGNAVMIDHGDGEYSVMMHMQYGSVKVVQGQTVKQGDAIGRIGASGEANQPHVHFQLQTGPDLFRDPSVPVTFTNVKGPLVRGRYFRAR